jgi:hypothetical protein
MRSLVRALATAACCLGGLALLSYALGWEPLRRWLEPPMAVNTAFAVVLLGLAILFLTVEAK